MLTFNSDDPVPFGVYSFYTNRKKIRAIDTYFKPNDVYDGFPFGSWGFILGDARFFVCGDFVDNWVYYKRMLPNKPC